MNKEPDLEKAEIIGQIKTLNKLLRQQGSQLEFSQTHKLTPQKIGFRKLIKAIRNCDKEVQDSILAEYKRL